MSAMIRADLGRISADGRRQLDSFRVLHFLLGLVLCLRAHLFNGGDGNDEEERQATGDWGSRCVYH